MQDAERYFEALYDAHYGDVLAYAVRRCVSRQDAEDVVAETFAVAWRRLDELPAGDQTRLWLFGTARLVRQNHQRSQHRQQRLAERLRQRLLPTASRRGPERDGGEHELQRAVAALSAADREILQLHAWEGLTAEQIATTLDIAVPAAWKRLQRARDRLSAELGRNDRRPSAVSAVEPARKAAR